MAIVHGYKGALYYHHDWFATVNLTGRSNEMTLAIDAPAAEVSSFGTVVRSFVGGQFGWTLDCRGWIDVATGTTNPDGAFSTAIMSGTIGSVTVMPQGSASGYPIYPRGDAWLTNYGVTANLGGGVNWTARFQGSGTLIRSTGA